VAVPISLRLHARELATLLTLFQASALVTMEASRESGWLAGRRPAMSSDRTSSSYKRGAVGSNPTAPTVLAAQRHIAVF